MGKSLFWRWVLIAIIVIGWAVSIYPPTDKDFYETFTKEVEKGQKDGKAGLDAQLKEVIADAKATQAVEGSTVSDARALQDAALKYNLDFDKYISLHKNEEPSNEEIMQYIRRISKGKLRLGLDLKGGTEFIIAFEESEIEEGAGTAIDARDQIMEIIRNRIDQTGVLEPEIMAISDTAISVKIATTGQDDVQKFTNILQQTAKLEFRMVHEENDLLMQEESEMREANPQAINEVPGYERMVHNTTFRGEPRTEILWIKMIPEAVSGKNIVRAGPTMNEFGQYMVSLEFDTVGGKLFADLTRKYADMPGDQRMAIVLDGAVYSAPTINVAITGGRAVIEGTFTRDEASQLGVVLQSGNLPVDIRIESTLSTDPTLGAASVEASITAALAGIGIVVIFMLIYYFMSGVIANIALVLNMVLVMGTLPILDATITLPGLAGIILTIGMAVDANVLIFERIREELNTGKSVPNAISRGYASAFSTILDANLTTLFVAFILMKFGSGPIRGFGVTLSIGIVASMFTALFVTRACFDTLLHFGLLKGSKLKMLSIIDADSIPFLNWRKLAAIGSIIAIVLSLGTFFYRGGDAMSVDFSGGTALNYRYTNQVPVGDVISAVEDHGYEKPRVHYKFSATDGGQMVEIVLGEVFPAEETPAEDVLVSLNEAFPDAKFEAGSTDAVGALVSHRFLIKAITSSFWALIAIILYISFRFEFGYALGAVAALLHDVLIGTGIFLIWGMGDRQISLTVVAGLLTIIGYSLNDTIVVFDRIRENVGLHKKMNFIKLINMSISQTLSRTVLTSVTTLIVVVILFIFGGGSINDFALIMIIGVLVGTYSSVFVATPVMLMWHTFQAKRKGIEPSEAAQQSSNDANATA